MNTCLIRQKGFEDELSRQRADSERIKSEKNEKIDRLQTELDQATDKIGELQDDVDQKQLEGSRSKSKPWPNESLTDLTLIGKFSGYELGRFLENSSKYG